MRSESHDDEPQPEAPEQEAWDADDPRRQKDQWAPPAEPCECFCLHCRRTFMSDKIWFQKINGARDGLEGAWMCPTPNCGGEGFTFDIFPVDPKHPANDGWFGMDDDDSSEECAWQEDEEEEGEQEFFEFDEEEPETEYDPDEPQYQMMDQWAGEDDDLEGEEWKHGLEPGQRPEPAKPDWVIEEEKKYDEPDRRPRERDWTDLERPERGGPVGEDDIPF